MANVTFIVGLPGSGKTIEGRKRAEAQGIEFFDDPRLEDIKAIEAQLLAGRSVIVADPHLCRKVDQDAAIKWATLQGATVEWVFFENDPEQARTNVQLRNDGRLVENMIRLSSRNYHIRENTTVLPVYRP